ncbi:hypothetical protein ACFL1M_02575 [Patescibacteria group bacterium]
MSKLIADTPLGTFEGIGGYQPTAGASGSEQIALLMSNILGFLTVLGGITMLIYFTVGGLGWLTGSGDKAKVDKAKDRMTNAAIGMIIIVVSYGIVWVVGKVLGFDILDPATEIDKLDPGA